MGTDGELRQLAYGWCCLVSPVFCPTRRGAARAIPTDGATKGTRTVARALLISPIGTRASMESQCPVADHKHFDDASTTLPWGFHVDTSSNRVRSGQGQSLKVSWEGRGSAMEIVVEVSAIAPRAWSTSWWVR